MADQNLNANSNNANQSSSSGGSPWDEPLDIPEDNKKPEPVVIGSLEPLRAEENSPVPFNVPEEIIEDKVGKTIPASQVIEKNIKPDMSPLIQAGSISAQMPSQQLSSKPPTADKNPMQPDNQNGIAQTHAATPNKLSPVAVPRPNLDKNVQKPQVFTNIKAEPNLEKTTIPGKDNKASVEKFADVNPVEDNNIKNTLPQRPNNNLSPVAKGVASMPAEENKPKESGVSELLRKDDFDPFAPEPEVKPKADISLKNANQPEKNIPEPTPPAKMNVDDNSQLRSRSNNISNITDTKFSDRADANNIDAVRLTDNVKEPDALVDLPTEAEPPSLEKPRQENFEKVKKPSLASRMGIFSRKKAPAKSPNKGTDVIKPLAKNSMPLPDQIPVKPKNSRPKKKTSPAFSIVISAVFIFVAAGYLTEVGLLSVSLENVYGFIGLEKVWGGLPKSTESALGMAIINQQQHMSFKYSGSITVTVDKTKKSPVTSPLVTFGSEVVPLADVQMGIYRGGILTQSDYDSSLYGDSSSSSSSSSDDTIDSVDVISPTPSQTDTDDSSASDSTYDSDSSTITESTIKQLNFDVSGKSSDIAATSSLVLKPLVGANKNIELINSGGNIYVKSDDISFDPKAVSGKWLEYTIKNLSANNNLLDIYKLKTDTGLSITGSRIANEKVGGVRAYKYNIESLELGDALDSVGIPQESLNSISGYVWIGVSDHLIHKIDVNIEPSISAGFSKISAKIDFSEYNVNNDIIIPVLGDVIKIDSSNPGETPIAPEPIPTELDPVTVPPSDRVANDVTRHNDLIKIKEALNKYKAAYGRYPISGAFENVDSSSSKLKKALVPTYISVLPSDPKSGLGWWYGYKSNGTSFTLSARFENIYDTEVTKAGDAYLHYVKN